MNAPAERFEPSFDELRARVDRALSRWLDGKADELPEGAPLVRIIQDALDAGGKRLRPAFCYWGYRSVGATDERILQAAAALELLHTFAIVHDDIMDKGETRRGEPSVYAQHGVNVAMLAGDLSLVLADSMFMEADFDAEVRQRAFAHYGRMREQVIAGQYLDLTVTGLDTVTEESAKRIAVLKSGLYTVVEPLIIGAELGGGDAKVQHYLRLFGLPLGFAFQMHDDLLGIFGDGRTGKPLDSDIREGKRNVLFAKTLDGLEGSDLEYFVSHWGKGDELDDTSVERLRSLVESSGARKRTEQQVAQLSDEAIEILRSLPIEDDAREALSALTVLATSRSH
ncbi:MAG: geranylgeranyl diphosphate synthase, type [Actinomycetota bacterium]|nr:geranylgeranyl diphosphate synthase, type [Actinomycetota bacterium]